MSDLSIALAYVASYSDIAADTRSFAATPVSGCRISACVWMSDVMYAPAGRSVLRSAGIARQREARNAGGDMSSVMGFQDLPV